MSSITLFIHIIELFTGFKKRILGHINFCIPTSLFNVLINLYMYVVRVRVRFNQVNKLGSTGKIIVNGLLYLHVHHILCALGFRAYLSVWREVGEFFYEAFSVFPSLYFTLFFSVTGACLLTGLGA